MARGFSYWWPRTKSTIGWWLTPMPSRKRPPNASFSVRWPAAIDMASRAQTLAIPVATTMRSVAPSSSALFTNGSRPTASGSQTAG